MAVNISPPAPILGRPGIATPEQKHRAKELWLAGWTKVAIARHLEIPRSTLRGWCKAWADSTGFSPVPAIPEVPTEPAPRLRAVEPTRFQQVLKILEAVAGDQSQPGAVRIQACNAMLKAIAMQATLPRELTTGEPLQDLKSQIEDVSGLSETDLATEYRRLLDS